MKRAAILLAVAGCDRLFGVGDVHVDDARLVDAAPDILFVDAVSGCFGTAFVTYCPSQPLPFLALGDEVIDTDPGSAACMQATNGIACVIAGFDVAVTGHVVAKGSRPLAIVAARALHVAATGSVDVSSHDAGASIGAAANDASCVTATVYSVTMVMSTDFASGGPGGSFGGHGGNAGHGGDGSTHAAAAPVPTPLATLRGGCRGTTGGNALNAAGGRGGDGGGAIALIAGRSVSVDGSVLAYGGGGGGGAQMVAGMHGADPSNPATAASGGNGGSTAPNGGGGSTSSINGSPGGSDAATCGSNASGGGGGGGGAAGFVVLRGSPTIATGATVVPPPT